jgi:hypothetical protein
VASLLRAGHPVRHERKNHIVDDQNSSQRRRFSPLAVGAVAGLAGLVFGLSVSSAATGTETPAPSTSAPSTGTAEDGSGSTGGVV